MYSGNTKCISQTGPQEACMLHNHACGLNLDSVRENMNMRTWQYIQLTKK